MPFLRLIIVLGLTLTLIITLNRSTMGYPPLGRLLDPVNGFWANAEADTLPPGHMLELPHARAAVKVHWSEHLVPHVVAQNETDVYYMQGYLTAYHRLGSMELRYLRLAGRLSELLGEKALRADRYYRRIGLQLAAERAWERIQQDPHVLAMLAAYTQGINDYIAQLNYRDYPIVYKVLDYEPALWSPLKSCLIMKGLEAEMSLVASRDIERTRLVHALGAADLDLLYGSSFVSQDAVLPEGESFDFQPKGVLSPARLDTPYWRLPEPLNESETGLFALRAHQLAIGRTRTSDSTVMLAHAIYGALRLPSPWYILKLQGPKGPRIGASWTGIPGLLIGNNEHIAWGFSPTARDMTDWYRIQFHGANKKEYLYNKKRYKAHAQIERFNVRGQSPFYDTVRYTHHGPVVYDAHFTGRHQDPNSVDVALCWAGHAPSNPLRWIYAMGYARSYRDIEKTVQKEQGPLQYTLMGSAHGPIALWTQGHYPIKWKGQGRLLLDGTQPSHDWQNHIPLQHTFQMVNPEQGFISVAHQAPVRRASAYPYGLDGEAYEVYKNRRINDRLSTIEGIRPAQLMRLQSDHFNYLAYEALPLLLDSLHTDKMTLAGSQVHTLLRQWDYFNRSESLAALYFAEWFEALHQRLWDELVPIAGDYLPTAERTMALMRQYPQLSFYDDRSSLRREGLSVLINESFTEVVNRLSEWKALHPNRPLYWGAMRPVALRHILKWPSFGLHALELNGSPYSLNYANQKGSATTLRWITHFSKDGKAHAWGVYPGGQTENIGHPLYAHFVPTWQQGNYLNLSLKTNKTPAVTQTFKPQRP